MKSRRLFSAATGGFTLSEILIAGFLSTIVVGAVASLTIAAIKTYYVESDYLEIGGQNRRLTDLLIEQGTLADDLIVFHDISDLTAAVQGDRGDCLMIFNRDTASPVSRVPAWGFITRFECYYLGRTSGSTGPVSLWHFSGIAPAGQETADAATALTTYTRSSPTRVSGDIFNGVFPRTTPSLTIPLTPREGVFGNDNARAPNSPPTVLVNLPTRLAPRGTGPKVTSNLTFAISPRK
jgi:hypothetical protein